MALIAEAVTILWQAAAAFTGLLSVVWSLLSSVVTWAATLLGTLFSALWSVVATATSVLLNLVWKLLSLFTGAFTLLWGWLVFGALFVAATVLNVLGIDDVYARLSGVVGDRGSVRVDIDGVDGVSEGEITDDAGRFSPAAFERTTGITPAEFVHLYVRSNGGRVRQQTIATCLPWSKATVSRLLDDLETEGVAIRVNNGRENIVCTPEAVPDHVDREDVYPDFGP